MANKTTPRPWLIAKDFQVVREDLDGDTVIAQVLQPDYAGDNLKERSANAAFIVAAVNSHDALIKAVEFTLKYHAMMSERGNGKELPTQLESSLRAALKLAEGESQ